LALLEAGARLEERNKEGLTPLLFAAQYNENPRVITTLLKAGAKLDSRDKAGKTPLMAAALHEKSRLIRVAKIVTIS
jgi:ankyrin repeat protein